MSVQLKPTEGSSWSRAKPGKTELALGLDFGLLENALLCNPGWPQTDNHLPQPPGLWDYSHSHVHHAYL